MKKYSSITRVNSHRISRNKKIKKTIAIVVVGLFLLWLAPKVISGFVALVFSPINSTETWLRESGQSFPQFFRDRSDLVAEIRDLRSQTPEGSKEKVTITGLWHENNELRRLQSANDEPRILASVIARPNQVPYDSLVLDRGSNDGVVLDAPVYIASTTVIGFVKNVFPGSSVAKLITTPGFNTSVYVYGPNIYTNAEGMGGGVLRVGVPQGIPLEEGNVVVLPSVNLGIFGEINTVESEPTSPEQYGYVTTDIPLNNLRLVNIGEQPLTTVDFEVAKQNVKETIEGLFTVPIPAGVLVDIDSTSTASSTLADDENELVTDETASST